MQEGATYKFFNGTFAVILFQSLPVCGIMWLIWIKHLHLDGPCWFSQRRSRTPNFWGAYFGGYGPQIRTQLIFLYNAPIPQVSSSCVYSFWSYRVDKHTNKQTNKQTPLKTSTFFATLLHWVTKICVVAFILALSVWTNTRCMISHAGQGVIKTTLKVNGKTWN